VIDPAFTLPMLVGALLAWRGAVRVGEGTRPLVLALAVAAAYFSWTLLAQRQLESAVRAELVSRNYGASHVLVNPTPFNSVLWRVLVSDDQAYATGYYSYWWKEGRLSLEPSHRATATEREARELPVVQRLNRSTHGYGKVEEDPEHGIVYTDLRMGLEPDYIFRFVVADRMDGRLVARVPPEQLDWPSYDRAQLGRVWRRIFAPD
jgi:inner membrane protein